jgi:phosphatidylinositol glycan class B
MPPELFWPFILRPILALLTRTFFQPDEYFQALEPAHRIVFGYGRLTWEWVSEPPIRSIAYPAVWVPVYWILKVTGFDQGTAIVGSLVYVAY